MRRQVSQRNMKKQDGFTLVELIVVVVLLGIVGAIAGTTIFGSSTSAPGTASQMMDLADKGTATFSAVRLRTGTSADPTTSNTFFQGDNNLLDMLYGGATHVATTNNYRQTVTNMGLGTFQRALRATTMPGAGTAGVYQLIETTIGVTVAAGAGANEVNWVYSNVTPEVVQALIEKQESGTYDGTADTTGVLQYTAVASGVHTVTLVRRAN